MLLLFTTSAATWLGVMSNWVRAAICLMRWELELWPNSGRCRASSYRGLTTRTAPYAPQRDPWRALNRPALSGPFTLFESESERHVIFASCEQLSARVA